MNRPAGFAAVNAAMPFGRVLLDPVRSADPPTISGTAAVSASSACSEATRVAISLGAAASFSLTPRTAAASASLGRSPARRRSNSARRSGATLASRCSQASLVVRERCPGRAPGGTDVGGHLERRPVPAQPLAGALDLVEPERRTMGLFAARLGRRAEADDGAAGDQAGAVGCLRLGDRGGDRLGVVAVDPPRIPAAGLEPPQLVDRIRQRQRTVDRDAVVVEQHREARQPQMAGERDRLLADTFHEVAVGRDDIGAVVDHVGAEFRRQMPLGDRHADGVGEALPERPGGGLDARHMAVLGVAGGDRAQLAEALDLADGHRLVAEEMKQRIEHHRAMARGQHEAVAVGPARIGGVEFEEAREQHGGDIGGAHGQPGMARLRRLDRVHRQRPNGIGETVMGRARCESRRNGSKCPRIAPLQRPGSRRNSAVRGCGLIRDVGLLSQRKRQNALSTPRTRRAR